MCLGILGTNFKILLVEIGLFPGIPHEESKGSRELYGRRGLGVKFIPLETCPWVSSVHPRLSRHGGSPGVSSARPARGQCPVLVPS